jgi:hypothetical protein
MLTNYAANQAYTSTVLQHLSLSLLYLAFPSAPSKVVSRTRPGQHGTHAGLPPGGDDTCTDARQ